MKKIIFVIFSVLMTIACTKDDGKIIGTASADDGNVLSGITVKLYSEDADFLKETKTTTTGDFSFHGLDSGNYYIAATITVDGEIWDTGNMPQIVYVSGDIEKKVTLKLTKKVVN